MIRAPGTLEFLPLGCEAPFRWHGHRYLFGAVSFLGLQFSCLKVDGLAFFMTLSLLFARIRWLCFLAVVCMSACLLTVTAAAAVVAAVAAAAGVARVAVVVGGGSAAGHGGCWGGTSGCCSCYCCCYLVCWVLQAPEYFLIEVLGACWSLGGLISFRFVCLSVCLSTSHTHSVSVCLWVSLSRCLSLSLSPLHFLHG